MDLTYAWLGPELDNIPNSFRREYIDILNANTFSLDEAAEINIALREAASSNNWNKHAHVQWIVDHMVTILDALIPG